MIAPTLAVLVEILAALPAAALTPASGVWTISGEPSGPAGRTLQIDARGDDVVVTLSGYRADGSSAWYFASAPLAGPVFAAGLRQFTGGTPFGGDRSSARESAGGGVAVITFVDEYNGLLTLPRESAKPIAKAWGAEATAGLRPANGFWAIASELDGRPGRGFHLDTFGATTSMTFLGYAATGPSQWHSVTASLADGAFAGPLLRYGGGTAIGGTPSAGRVAANAGPVAFATDGAHAGLVTLPGEAPQRAVRQAFGPADGAFVGNILLGAPTDSGVTVSVLATQRAGYARIAYGIATEPEMPDRETGDQAIIPGVPARFTLSALRPATGYRYRMVFRAAGSSEEISTPAYGFRTAPAPGTAFVFTVQADPHLDANTHPDRYRRTLANVLADSPDFHLDLGDTFMSEKHTGPFSTEVRPSPDAATVASRYRHERAYFGQIAHSVPLFLANGNHDGEAGWLDDGTGENVAAWAAQARREHFPAPSARPFFSGDVPADGRAFQDTWYAWTWGDALFVVLDPYVNTVAKPGADGWTVSLGQRQHEWLERTLAGSTASFTFVFVHNLVGGLDGQMRGGAEAVPFFEWGGRNADGTPGFPSRRPGWSAPIHSLLVTHGVTAVFHGHDHLYAWQEVDGIVYQAVPQPGAANTQSVTQTASEGGYGTGTLLPSAGHLRIAVGPDGARVEYVRAWLPAEENASRRNGEIAHRWTARPGPKADAR